MTPWAEGVTGGVQTTTTMLARHFAIAGHEVEVLAPAGGPRDTWTERPAHLSYRPMRAPFDPARPFRSTISYLATAPLEIRRLRKLLKTRAFDVVNIHYPLGLFTSLAVATIGGPSLVVSCHGSDLLPGQGATRIDPGVRMILRLAQVVISPSGSFGRRIEERYPACLGKVRIVSHGIAEPPPAGPCPWPRPYILSVAGLRALKNLDHLITGFASLAPRIPDLDLILAGSGPQREQLAEQVRALHLEQRVHFVGSVPPAETGTWQSWATVVAAPSPNETFGLAAAEAMIRGRPVVVAREGALGELVEDGVTGLLVSAARPDEIAAQIERLVADPELAAQLGAAGRAAMHARYSPAAMVAGYEAVFAGVRRTAGRSSTVGAGSPPSPKTDGTRRD